MKWYVLLLVGGFFQIGWSVPLCPGDSCRQNACAGWQSMQQLRSVIPERIWEQDFSVIVDRKAFQRALGRWGQKKDSWGTFANGIAQSHCHFTRSTISGEYVRILDRYQEVQGSPFWDNPSMMSILRDLDKQVLKEACNR